MTNYLVSVLDHIVCAQNNVVSHANHVVFATNNIVCSSDDIVPAPNHRARRFDDVVFQSLNAVHRIFHSVWFALNHACGVFKPVLNTFKKPVVQGPHGDQPCATATRTPHPAMRYDDPSVFWDSDTFFYDMPDVVVHHPHTTMAKPKLNLRGLSTLQKVQKTNDIVAALTGNTNFTTPSPTLAAVTASSDGLSAAYSAREALMSSERRWSLQCKV